MQFVPQSKGKQTAGMAIFKEIIAMKYATFFLLLLVTTVKGQMAQGGMAVDQKTFFADANGKPLYLQNAFVEDGHPYHNNLYQKASLYLKNGKVYGGYACRLNLMTQELAVKLADESEIIVDNVARLTFSDGRIFVQPLQTNTWYERLDSGKVQLLKAYTVSFTDSKGYGQATTTRTYSHSSKLYSLKEHQLQLLEKSVAGLLIALPDKAAQIEAYCKEQKLKCRKEEEILQVIQFYNGL
jgi:hypothetical protein